MTPLPVSTEEQREAAFWRKVDARGPDECWDWRGGRDSNGYGLVRWGQAQRGAHRTAYQLQVGPIPAGLVIDHLCGNRACQNARHLEPVTQRENVLRYTRLITHCPQGHEYNEVNTHLRGNGARDCRTCGRVRARQKRRETSRRTD